MGSGYPQVDSSQLKYKVVAYDFGIKYNILRCLVDAGCDVTVVPATFPAEEALAMNPDGIFLSNGPGDPEPLVKVQENIREFVGKKPIFGICLGHQLLGLALGGKTIKLQFGNHGSNLPVMDMATGKVEITAQNHGFAVDLDSLGDVACLGMRTSTTRLSRESAIARCRSFQCSIIRRRRRGRMIRIICFRDSWN